MELPEIKVKLNADELKQRKEAVRLMGLDAEQWTLNRLWMQAKQAASPRKVELVNHKGDGATFQTLPDSTMIFDLTTAGSLAHALGSMPPDATTVKLIVGGIEVTDTMTKMVCVGMEVELHVGKKKKSAPKMAAGKSA